MKRLRKLLSNSTKVKRRQRTLLNISITILAWLVEFIGFFVTFLVSFILGYESDISTIILQVFSYTIRVIICPSTFLVNNYEMKNKIMEDNTYQRFIQRFACCQKIDEEDVAKSYDDDDDDANENMEEPTNN